MNIDLILEKLTNLDNATNFIAILELKVPSDNNISTQLEIAKKSLDKALINFISDIEENLNATPREPRKISNLISDAFEQLRDINDESLNCTLQDLLIFTKNYEVATISSNQKPENLKNLKAKILSITSRRFG